MTGPLIRPRFELRLDQSPGDVMQRLRNRLLDCTECTGASVGHHAELFVAESERRVWSPWLSVTAEDREGGGSKLRGRFGPHPAVWTLYLFLAFALGFALLVGVSWGYAQWAMDVTPWALYSVPVILVLGASMYGISLVGQRLGASQMASLRIALEGLVAPSEQATDEAVGRRESAAAPWNIEPS